LLALAAACGAGAGADDSPADAAVDAGPLDLASAVWDNTPIGVRPDTTALRPDLAITDGGEVVVVWADVLDLENNNSPILSASSADDFAEELRSPVGAGGFSRPAISAAGERLHLVFAGDGGAGNSDIFYSAGDGGAWSAPVNITAPVDAANLVQHNPAVVEAGGAVTAVFLGHASSMTVQPDGLFAIRFTDPSSPGAIETLVDPATGSCADVEAVSDGEAVHLIANCAEAGVTNLLYFTDRSGSFVRQTVELGSSRSPFTPDIAVDDSGGVHLLWVGLVDCPSGSCRDVFHSRGLAPPTSITGQSEDGGFMPVLGVDPLGRVIAAFHRLGNVDDVLWTYAEDGGGFVRTQVATPGTAGTTEWQPGAVEINPVTGRAHMAFLRSADGNSDIVHGELR
jgi:hypothetical protein